MRDYRGRLFSQSNLRSKSAPIKSNHLLMNQITWINVDIFKLDYTDEHINSN